MGVESGRFAPCFSGLSTMLGGLRGINIYWGVVPYVIILLGRNHIKELRYAYDFWTSHKK